MTTKASTSASEMPDLNLTAAYHKINHQPAQDMINLYKPAGVGAYFTLDTIRAIINPPNAGIRFYFTIHNTRLTVMICAVQRMDIARYDDLERLKLAVSDSLNVVKATDQSILLADATLCNRTYRASTHFSDGRKGGLFGIEAIQSIIRQTGCAGIRFYFGLDADAIKTIVLYGVDTTGQNLTDYICDQNWPCPNYCGVNNQLNS